MDKKICCIELFNEIFTTEKSLEEVKALLEEEWNYMIIDDHIFNKNTIHHIYCKMQSEIEKEKNAPDIFSRMMKKKYVWCEN